MSEQPDPQALARFRFSNIGHLLAAPSARGELHRELPVEALYTNAQAEIFRSGRDAI